MRRYLGRRLVYLWTFELFNGVLFLPLVYAVIGRVIRLGWFSHAALATVCAILMMGGSFWYLKWRTLHGSELLHLPSTRRFYRAAKPVFAVAAALLPVLLLIRAIVTPKVSPAELLVGSGLALLALAEYVNYFHVQLSYDNREDVRYLLAHRKLKRATMVRDGYLTAGPRAGL